jgi:NifU-like protein involved in Fe-S cluster formation
MKNKKNTDKKDFSLGQKDSWIYSDIVKKHFFKPKNLLLDESKYKYDSLGQSNSANCGDIARVWLKIDKKTNKITGCKWRTFGCAPAIASSSMISLVVTENGGMIMGEAIKLKPEQIIERLGGLPDRKFHCSILGLEALHSAIENYLNKTK